MRFYFWYNIINKVLPADILVADERGYGGGEEWIDYRLLELLAPSKGAWGTYYCYNPIQQARYNGNLKDITRVYNGMETLWLDKNLEIWRLISSPSHEGEFFFISLLQKVANRDIIYLYIANKELYNSLKG